MKNKGTEMNDKYHKQSFALRAIYEERACPPDDVLRQQSEEIRSHLGYCRYCNERLEAAVSDSKEWRELVQHMRPTLLNENNNPEIVAPGQIWSLDSSQLGGWGPYDRFYTPPLVVVLEIRDQGKTARVAQLCGYTELIGDDGVDVYLESTGFAESWNVYSVPRQYLKQCRGNVGLISVEKILLKSRYQPQQAETSQFIKQFRELEIQVGAFMAMQALPQVMEAVEQVAEEVSISETACETLLFKLFGTVGQVKEKMQDTVDGWNLPDSVGSIFDFLTGARPLQHVPLMAADAGVVRQVNWVREQPNGLLIEALYVTITNNDLLDDGTYFIAGKLSRESVTTLHLLASLKDGETVIAESQCMVSPGTLYFCVEFSKIPRHVSKFENVKMLLVSP